MRNISLSSVNVWTQTMQYLAKVLIVTLIYYSTSWLSHFLEAGQRGVMPIPLAAGVALTALLLFGLRFWPAILLGQVALKLGQSIPYSFMFFDASGAVLQAVLAAWLLRQMEFPNAFLRMRDVLLFAVITLLISAPAGSSLAAVSLFINPIPLNYALQIWLTSWCSDGVGMLILTSTILTWRQLRSPLLKGRQRLLELLLILLCLTVVSSISLTIDYGNRYLFFYMILPFAVWAAVRFEQYGATLGSLLVAVILLTGGLNRLNLAGRIEAGTTGLMLEIAFIALTAFTAYLVAAAYTERRQAEENVIQEKELALATLHSIANAVITTDEKGYIRYLNPAAENLLQWSHTQALYKSVAEVFRLKNMQSGQPENPITRCLHGVVCPPHQSLLTTHDGSDIMVDSSAAPIRHRDGHIAGVIIVFHQITPSATALHSHKTSSSHSDALNLCQRQEFEHQLAQELLVTQRDHNEHVLLHLESDLFKTVYTRYGQAAGNSLLQQWLNALQKRVRQGDVLSRISGQSFVVLLKNCPVAQAEAICQQFIDSMQAFSFHWGGQHLHGQLYIGAVAVMSNSDSAGLLMQRAEQACQIARNNTEQHYHVAFGNLPVGGSLSEETHWSTELRQALAEKRLLLFQQRIVDSQQLHTHGVEILVRLQDKEDNLIPAARFLPVLGRHSQILRLDRWVVQHVMDFFANTQQQQKLPEGFLISINLSADTLSDTSFIDFVRGELQRTGLKSWQFCFEIDEVDAQAHQQHVGLFINSLRQLGCQVALDNFGNHAASLNALREWSVNYLKLDGHLVQAASTDPFSEQLLTSIQQLCQLLHIHTLGAWVEDETSLAVLQRLKIPFVQGFGIAKPEPLQWPLLD